MGKMKQLWQEKRDHESGNFLEEFDLESEKNSESSTRNTDTFN